MSPITLVLLPGMHGSGVLFETFLKELPDWITPVVVSYPPDKVLGYSGHLDIVMSSLPEDQSFVLLGESFSGPLALMAAARHPKGLRGVILCATFATWPLPFPPAIASLIIALGPFRFKSTHLFLRLLFGKKASIELKNLFAEALAYSTPEVLTARARAVMKVDCTAELRSCQVPLLVMVADNDRIVAGRCSESIRSIWTEAEVVHFNAPHLILQSVPVEAARRIRRFIEAVRAGDTF